MSFVLRFENKNCLFIIKPEFNEDGEIKTFNFY